MKDQKQIRKVENVIATLRNTDQRESNKSSFVGMDKHKCVFWTFQQPRPPKHVHGEVLLLLTT